MTQLQTVVKKHTKLKCLDIPKHNHKQEKPRKTVFIVNPLFAKSNWRPSSNSGSRSNSCSRSNSVSRSCPGSRSMSVWLHLTLPDVSVERDAAYRINSLMYTALDDIQASKHGKLI